MITAIDKAIRPPRGLDFSTEYRKPLLKRHSIPVDIRRYFTNVDGTIQAKAGIPAILKTAYPFYLLGYFDLKGGFSTGLKSLPPQPGTFYLTSFIEGSTLTSAQITGFSGLNDIRSKIRTGDIVHVFTDDLTAPNFFIWIVQSSRNGSIGSIVANSDTLKSDEKIGPVFIDHFQYFTDQPDNQWNVPLYFTRSSNIASFQFDQVQPYIFKNPNTQQDGFIRVACRFNLDQYKSIGTNFLFDTESISINFQIQTNE